MLSYRDTLAAAWRVAWRRPWLWLLGLFAATMGNTGEYQMVLNAFDRLGDPGQTWWWPTAWSSAMAGSSVTTLLTTLLVLLILLVVLWLSVRSTNALFAASDSLLAGRPTSLRESWSQSAGRFWATLGLTLIGKILTGFLLLMAVAPLVLAIGTGSSRVAVIIGGVVSFIIFVPISIVIGFATKYGIAYAVLERRPFGHALADGWALFWRNWLVSLEVALVLFAIGAAASVALAATSIVVLTVIVSLNTVLGTTGLPVLTGDAGFLALRILSSILVLPVVLVVGGILSSFQTAAWTAVFRYTSSQRAVPKLLRLLARRAAAPAPVAPVAPAKRRAAPARRSRR